MEVLRDGWALVQQLDADELGVAVAVAALFLAVASFFSQARSAKRSARMALFEKRITIVIPVSEAISAGLSVMWSPFVSSFGDPSSQEVPPDSRSLQELEERLSPLLQLKTSAHYLFGSEIEDLIGETYQTLLSTWMHGCMMRAWHAEGSALDDALEKLKGLERDLRVLELRAERASDRYVARDRRVGKAWVGHLGRAPRTEDVFTVQDELRLALERVQNTTQITRGPSHLPPHDEADELESPQS